MSYARARLILGISGVGTWVLISLALFGDPPPAHRLLLLYLGLSFPFDLLGGQILPRHWGQPALTPGSWLRQWSRAALVQALVMAASGCLLILSARFGMELLVALAVMVVMLLFQEELAQASGTLSGCRRTCLYTMPVSIYASDETDFSGGIAGLPGRERIILPEVWPSRVAVVGVLRRKLMVESGARTLGVLVALAWNLTGFWLASQSGLADLTQLSRSSLGFTLWSFLGLLLLPTLSRMGARYADYRTWQEVQPESFALYLDWACEPAGANSGVTGQIFYPIPEEGSRLKQAPNRSPLAPWNPARTALYLSWSCLGLLGRAVHCNSGRPALWVFPPVD